MKRRRAGIVVGLVALLVLVAGAGVAVVVWLGQGGSEADFERWHVEVATERPELAFRIDEDRARQAGADSAAVTTVVRAATVGLDVAEGVVLRLGAGAADDPPALENVLVPTRSGAVPLSALGTLERAHVPVALLSLDGTPAVVFRVAAPTDARASVRARATAIEAPPGLRLRVD